VRQHDAPLAEALPLSPESPGKEQSVSSESTGTQLNARHWHDALAGHAGAAQQRPEPSTDDGEQGVSFPSESSASTLQSQIIESPLEQAMSAVDPPLLLVPEDPPELVVPLEPPVEPLELPPPISGQLAEQADTMQPANASSDSAQGPPHAASQSQGSPSAHVHEAHAVPSVA
jgi:hypothetical protein